MSSVDGSYTIDLGAIRPVITPPCARQWGVSGTDELQRLPVGLSGASAGIEDQGDIGVSVELRIHAQGNAHELASVSCKR